MKTLWGTSWDLVEHLPAEKPLLRIYSRFAPITSILSLTKKESYGIQTTITWPVQSVIIVMEKRNVKAFNQHERHNEKAIALNYTLSE